MQDLHCAKYFKKYKKLSKYIFSIQQREKKNEAKSGHSVLFAAIMISQFWLKPWLL